MTTKEEAMAHATLDHLSDLQAAVVELLTERGIHAECWHSGGGIFGVRIESATGLSELFTTLDSDGGAAAWTCADWNDGSGDLIANLDVQVRPYAVDPKYGHTGTPLEFADALERVVERLK